MSCHTSRDLKFELSFGLYNPMSNNHCFRLRFAYSVQVSHSARSRAHYAGPHLTSTLFSSSTFNTNTTPGGIFIHLAAVGATQASEIANGQPVRILRLHNMRHLKHRCSWGTSASRRWPISVPLARWAAPPTAWRIAAYPQGL